MRAAYSEMLRRIQQEGLYRAQEQQEWQSQRLAERRAEDMQEQAEPSPPGGSRQDARAQAAPCAEPEDGPHSAADARQGAARPGNGRSWTDKDLVECRGCWYWRMLDYTLGLRACWYPLLEDRLRPCRPADCYRKPGTPYRPCDQPGPD